MLFKEQDYLNIHSHFKPRLPDEFVVRNAFMALNNESINHLAYCVSCGLHPWHINSMTLNECGDALIEQASNPKVLAIGETGLDKAIDIPLKKQVEYFDMQLNIARAFQKPVIIHSVKTHNELIPFLKKTKVPFIFHGFNGNVQQAKELLKYNCKISLGRNVHDEKTQRVLKAIPGDSFLLETDNAYNLTIADIYRITAGIRDMHIDELKSVVFHTFASVIKAE
jgi:TatD DNase family protein